jgi:flagellar basal body rod protein FlgC
MLVWYVDKPVAKWAKQNKERLDDILSHFRCHRQKGVEVREITKHRSGFYLERDGEEPLAVEDGFSIDYSVKMELLRLLCREAL